MDVKQKYMDLLILIDNCTYILYELFDACGDNLYSLCSEKTDV
jgi:hypothetical protein